MSPQRAGFSQTANGKLVGPAVVSHALPKRPDSDSAFPEDMASTSLGAYSPVFRLSPLSLGIPVPDHLPNPPSPKSRFRHRWSSAYIPSMDLFSPIHSMDCTASFSSCCASDLWIVKNLTYAARPDLSMKEGDAATLALQKLEKLQGSDAHKLCLVPSLSSHEHLQPLFANLNRFLFRDTLKESVSFRFSSALPADIHGSTSAVGVFGNQVVISLNRDLIRHPPGLTLVSALIHQMCHAYLLVCCGFGDGSRGDDKHDLKHGLAFSSILHSIQDLLVHDVRVSLPNLFSCSGRGSRPTLVPRSLRSSHRSLHSYCYYDVHDHHNKVACGAYIRRVNAAAELRDVEAKSRDTPGINLSAPVDTLGNLMSAQLPPSASHFPSLYPYPPYPTTLPTSGDYQALLNLQTFLTCGDYDPKIASALMLDDNDDDDDDIDDNRNNRNSSTMSGPPRIQIDDKHKCKESSPTNPMLDLRTYLLSQKASIEPLRRLALARLYSQRLLRKQINAMAFLEEIYTGSSDGTNTSTTNSNSGSGSGNNNNSQNYQTDQELRRFAQAFLCAPHPDLPTRSPGTIRLEYQDTIFGRRVTNETETQSPCDDKDNSNLSILQSHPQYKERLAQLRGKGGVFLEDLDKVVEALAKKEPIRMPDWVAKGKVGRWITGGNRFGPRLVGGSGGGHDPALPFGHHDQHQHQHQHQQRQWHRQHQRQLLLQQEQQKQRQRLNSISARQRRQRLPPLSLRLPLPLPYLGLGANPLDVMDDIIIDDLDLGPDVGVGVGVVDRLASLGL